MKQSASQTEVLLLLWEGDWRSAGLATGEQQPGWQYGVYENWEASEALRDWRFDPLWKPFHNDPRFRTIVTDVDQYVATQRSKLDSLRQQGLVPQRKKSASLP
jgi:hypothetical protein